MANRETNIGYHARIPQGLEKRLEALENGSGSGGYDLVFRTSAYNLDEITASNIVLESGTFADAYAKALSGKKLSIRFYLYDIDDGVTYTIDYDINRIYADRGYDNYISFIVTGGYDYDGNIFNGAVYVAATSGGSPTEKRYGVILYSPVMVIFDESGITVSRVG